MAQIGTGYMVAVKIESVNDLQMQDYNFTLDFYVYPNRRQTLRKQDLVRIDMSSGADFYALVDSRKLGEGLLRCRATIMDPQSCWTGGSRPVVLDVSTGKYIGGCGKVERPCACGWDEGYRVSFNFVTGIPKAEVAYIFYGNLVNAITDYSQITQDMLVDPTNHIVSVPAGKMGKTSCGVMNEGDKVVVLIPSDTGYTATKDNGFGSRMAFNTSLVGSNGDATVVIDGVSYRAYGEMMTTEGEMFIYVD
ncbi:MAG: hypothetical protein ACI4C3_01110 [Bacteroides sp.]